MKVSMFAFFSPLGAIKTRITIFLLLIFGGDICLYIMLKLTQTVLQR